MRNLFLSSTHLKIILAIMKKYVQTLDPQLLIWIRNQNTTMIQVEDKEVNVEATGGIRQEDEHFSTNLIKL